MKPLRIAVVGGGSTYTPELVEGFVRHAAELPLEHLVLMDISEERLRTVGGLAQRMLAPCGVEVSLTTQLDDALDGMDFVLTQMRIGGLAARALDEQLPLPHGVLGQETVGPGGFAKALRTIPVMLTIARRMADISPDATLINFTNPAGIVTEAILRHTATRAIGLCNVPINLRISLAQTLNVPLEAVELEYVGLNHLSWTRVWVDGKDVTAHVLATEWGTSGGQVDAGYLKAVGLLPNYYLRYYVHPDRVLQEQKNAAQSRGQYLQTVEAELLKLYSDPTLREKPKLLETRGGAHYSTAAVELIRSIALDRRDVLIVNTRNGTAVPDLPPDCAVEVPCVVSKTGARPLTMGSLPPTVRGLMGAVKAYEELTIQAAVTGSEDMAIMALFSNPLVGSWDKAVALWKAIKTAHWDYLPQFHPKGEGS
ncbi:MAG TPA: 6-phospho-beta-glucosidase [Aggregatilineales bacterium]|nr:6-phospho-beta-glucosidase [Anaerolineales bacterium]HRE46530.1 6-phospho-beta-glucosidase [Aggregatilineales bacterium]